jgi:SAM-dependent methyltransferase
MDAEFNLKTFYEEDANRFWDPKNGLAGRDLTIYPLLEGASGTIFEYGAGSGSLLLNLAKEARFPSLVGIDISQRALENMRVAANAMGVSNKVSLLAPTNDTVPEVPNGFADILLSLDTIEHVMNPYVVLDELYRIGKPDATFIISVPNYGYIKYVVQLAFGKQPVTGGDEPINSWRTTGWDGWHLHTFTRQSLDMLLRDCGWEPKLWTGYGNRLKFLAPLRKHYPALWSGALTVVAKRRQ